MAMSLVPLTTSPNQSFFVTLPVNGGNIRLKLSIAWNAMAEYWTMGITDMAKGEELASSIPLVSSGYPAANLLAVYDYLRIGSAYLIPTAHQMDNQPSIDNLGRDFLLIWGDNRAVP